MTDRPGLDFSFSGLKTFTRNSVPAGVLDEQTVADIAFAFQDAAVDTLVIKCARAMETTGRQRLVVAGGVAANVVLRDRLEQLARDKGVAFVAPPVALCTDNGAMVAWVGLERLRLGDKNGLGFRPRPRWPLDPEAPKAAFAGVKA